MALLMGTFIAPGMYQLASISDYDHVQAIYNLDYHDIITAIIILAISQTLIILFVIFISIKRPCTNFKNCMHCRETRQNGKSQLTP